MNTTAKRDFLNTLYKSMASLRRWLSPIHFYKLNEARTFPTHRIDQEFRDRRCVEQENGLEIVDLLPSMLLFEAKVIEVSPPRARRKVSRLLLGVHRFPEFARVRGILVDVLWVENVVVPHRLDLCRRRWASKLPEHQVGAKKKRYL